MVNFTADELPLLDDRWVKPAKYVQSKLASNIKAFRGSCSKIEEKYEKQVKNINGFSDFEDIIKNAVHFIQTLEVRTEIEQILGKRKVDGYINKIKLHFRNAGVPAEKVFFK